MRIRARALSLVVALAPVLSLALLAPVGAEAAAPQTVPYTDEYSAGYIGFCNTDNKPITSGSIYTVPFVWQAVASQAAPTGYTAANTKVVLEVYQPRQGFDAAEWSGMQLTGSTSYTDNAHPMAQATIGDQPLSDMVGAFPPQWDGFLELRLSYDGLNVEQSDGDYPATSIQIIGSTWHVVGSGTVDCGHVGAGISDETRDLSPAVLASHQAYNESHAVAAAGKVPQTLTGSSLPTSQTGANPTASATDAADGGNVVASTTTVASSHSYSPSIASYVVVAALLVLAALSGAAFMRRRQRPGPDA